MDAKPFQIKQDWGGNCHGFLYFEMPANASLKKIEEEAISTAQKDWNDVIPSLYFTAPKPCRPTIHIYEYKDGKKVKGGITLKTKWR